MIKGHGIDSQNYTKVASLFFTGIIGEINKIRAIFLLAISFLTVGVSRSQNVDSVRYIKPLFDFSYSKLPFKLTEIQAVNETRLLRFTLLTGYREGIQPVNGFTNYAAYYDVNAGTIRFYMFNSTIEEMLTHGYYAQNKIILEVKDPSKYRYDSSQGSKLDWMRKNAYCLEFLIPFGLSKNAIEFEEEITRLFHVKGQLENRMVNALILVRTSKKDKIRSKGKGGSISDNHGYLNNVSLTEEPFSQFLDLANMPPLIDETGYTYPVDMDLKIASWSNLSELKKAFKKYDLDLKLEKREIKMFVIKDI